MWFVYTLIGFVCGFVGCFFLVRARSVSTSQELIPQEKDIAGYIIPEMWLEAWHAKRCDACKATELGDKDGTEE